ncbi:MAG: carbamoyltransferase HypF, partial [Deltaproteobacteria bacterium]|nr:carbamoyltransferase HypF [Deltaproteobacteria bacterium]
DPATFSRSGHLQTFSLPGGDKAIREPWRIGAGLLRDCYGEGWQDYARKLALCNDQTQYELLDQVMHKNLNCPRTTSLGRLFDAVSALCGIRRVTSYEGQAAIELEAAATFDTDLVLPYDIIENNDVFIFDFHTMLQRLVEDLSAQKETELLPRAFHNTICHALTAMAEKIKTKTALNRIALSGGCFQNRLLLESCINMLQQKGFEVYAHHNVPTNDGGVSLGQAVIAGTRIKQGLE